MPDLTKQVDQIFAEWDQPASPGCALAVIRDGKIIYSRGYGMANLEHDVPIGPQTIFDIGSTSKQFTALCILLLARRGQLSLDDPIQKFLPELPVYEAPITVRHLVHHTSGIRDYLTLMALANLPFENDYQEAEVVSLIARQKALNFLPGDEHLYCNSGYFLMAEIVERVSGKNMRDFAEEHIFGPLGMKHTHFHNNFKEIVRHRASGYSPTESGGFEIDMGIFDVIGDGAIYTSVEDLYLWDQNYYDNRIDGGGQELIRQMEQRGVLNSGEVLEYAFALMISKYRGLPIVAHGGSWYGYRAQLLRFPEQRFSVVCLANLATMNPDMLCKKVADVYLADLLEPEAKLQAPDTTAAAVIDLPGEVLQRKIGMFLNEENGAVARVALGEDGLSLETMGYVFALSALSADHFQTQGAPVTLHVFFTESDNRITIDVNNGFQRHEFKRAAAVELTTDQLAEFDGSYYSPELDVTYSLVAGDGILMVEPKSKFIKDFKPAGTDAFTAGPANIRFVRADDGAISGFRIYAGRVKDIHFTRHA